MMRLLIYSVVLNIAFSPCAQAQSSFFEFCRALLVGESAASSVLREINESFERTVEGVSGESRGVALQNWLDQTSNLLQTKLSERSKQEIWKLIQAKLKWRQNREKLLEVGSEAVIQIHRAVGPRDKESLIQLADIALDHSQLASPSAREGRARFLAYLISTGALDREYWNDRLIHMQSSYLRPNDKSFRYVRSSYVKERLQTVFLAAPAALSTLGFEEDARIQLALNFIEALEESSEYRRARLPYSYFAENFQLETPSKLDRVLTKLSSGQTLEFWHRHYPNNLKGLGLVAKRLEKENQQQALTVSEYRIADLFRALQGVFRDPRIHLSSLNSIMKVIESAKDPRIQFTLNWNSLEQTIGKRSPLEFAEFVLMHRQWFSSVPPLSFVMKLPIEDRRYFLGQLVLRNVTDYQYVLSPQSFESLPEGHDLYYRHLLAFFSMKNFADYRYRGGKMEQLLAHVLEQMTVMNLSHQQRVKLALVMRDEAVLAWYVNHEGVTNMTSEEEDEILKHHVRILCYSVPLTHYAASLHLRASLMIARGFATATQAKRKELAQEFVQHWEKVNPHLPKEHYFSDGQFSDAFLLSPLEGKKIYRRL